MAQSSGVDCRRFLAFASAAMVQQKTSLFEAFHNPQRDAAACCRQDRPPEPSPDQAVTSASTAEVSPGNGWAGISAAQFGIESGFGGASSAISVRNSDP
jgi:hypothetical protein